MDKSVTPTSGDNAQPRDGKGKFRQSLDSAARDAAACEMYMVGKTYQQISDALGYGDRGNAHRAIQNALLDTIQGPADELRDREVARAQEIYLMARGVARTEHYAHSHGKIVYNREGEPLVDDGPKLSAMGQMLKAMERIAKLKGLDSPTKFENLSLDVVQAEIARLEAEVREAEESS